MTVPCIGAARASPEAAGARLPARALAARAWPRRPGRVAAPAARVAGSVTSRRLPSTSTTTVCLSAAAVRSVLSAAPSASRAAMVVAELGLDPPGVHGERPRVAVQFGGEGGVGDDGPVERQGGGQPVDLELGQGPGGALQRLLAGGAGDDELAEQRVPGGADHRAGLDAGVQPDAGPGGRLPGGDGAGRGQEAAAGVLGVDPELDRVAARARVAVVPSARAQGSPSAMRNISRTRSMPVTSSVTGCSTCRRVLTSRKEMVPSWPTRNSQVPAPT